MDKISLKAPAKINLYLKVLGKREDGYHEIESLMQAIDLYDEITVEKSDLLELECDNPSLPPDEDNLALKAATVLQQHAYFPGARIVLRKKIPVSSGLGGGSSDAAFVLRGISKLYNVELSPQEKLELAAKIGSDVPFFLSTGQAIIRGRGEKVYPVKLPVDYRIVLIIPPAPSSTAEVYGKLKKDLTKNNDNPFFNREITSSSFYRLIGLFGNDLEVAVLSDLPELSKIKNILLDSGCIYSSMTGSGSAVFGVFRTGKINISDPEKVFGKGFRASYCAPVLLPPL